MLKELGENEMNNNKVVVHTPICMILFIVFLVLKLTNVINWSWWWVTAPLWIPVSIVLALLLIAIAILGIIAIFNYSTAKDR